jgi:thioesterase domain-containing protein
MAHLPATERVTADSPQLRDLQTTLEREIPMSAQMGIRVHSGGPEGLVMRLPLGPNRNHQQTAFAGSLNAVCTVAGWGTVFLLLKDLGRAGNIVIRRSSIRYLQPVLLPEILARCQPVAAASRQYFLEMLDEKKQAKMDLDVEIQGPGGSLVAFNGSYVVTV